MEALSATSAVVGLAVPVFQSAKALRDRIKLVASEKSELLAALTEYEKDINLLESLYNDNKELLDQHKLDTDLKELAQIIHDLDEWLNSINPNLGKKKMPGLKELWKSGDLRQKVVASNVQISSIRTRWQMRMQVCTLASTNMILGQMDSVQTGTNVILGRMDSAQSETTALLQQVLTMLQQGPVRQRSCSLSMHSQVEPAGFNSQTTRVVANTTTSIATFSILSPDASLSYDRIKLRLEEYRTLLTSDSDTIELSTENGKTVICRKQANEMEEYLDQAEALLRDVVQSRDISTIVVLHQLRGLTKVLDKLKLHDECRLTGNCALDLAEALGRRSVEFRREQAETLALIAALPVYQPRSRTLFIQAVSICEEVVADDASHSSKITFLNVLNRAGHYGPDDLRLQWLLHAGELMTRELPPTMVDPGIRSTIYNNYGHSLNELKQHTSAVEAFNEAISIRRILATNDPTRYNPPLVRALRHKGMVLRNLGKDDDAVVALKEALEICTTVSAQDPLQYNQLMAETLNIYAVTLQNLSRFFEAAAVQKQAISLFRNLAQTGHECTRALSITLHDYGTSCFAIGKYAESVRAYQEAILLKRTLAATDIVEICIIQCLHGIVHAFLALGKHAEANAAANGALARDHRKVLEACQYAPNFKSCFLCRRAIKPDSPLNASSLLSFFAEIPKPTGETVNVPVRKRKENILGVFRRNRVQ